MKNIYKCLLFGVIFLLSTNLALAQFTVEGKVTTDNDDPLIGASVVIRGTTIGSFTDNDGQFSLEVPTAEAQLLISYVGYRTQELTISQSNNNLAVTMEEDITNLDEVVITGLASSIKRSNLANAVSTISNEELVGTTSPQTVDNALYGKLTGVNIRRNGGAPGGGLSVQLRGISTLQGSSQPLYIIDGVYVNNAELRNGRTQVSGASGGQNASTQDDASNRLADLNPEDIANIEVLKGPSAAAIYGTRANAGVVIITTKRGEAGRTKVRFNQDLGWSEALNLLGPASWDEDKISLVFSDPDRAALELERFRNATEFFDYEDVFYGNRGFITNSQLSVSGGNAKTRFYVSGNVRSEDGIIKNTGFDRRTIRANIDHRFNDRMKISVNSNYINSETDRGFTGNQNNTGASIGYNIAYIPTYFDIRPDPETGVFPDVPYTLRENPLAFTELGENTQDIDRYIQSVKFDATIFQTNRTSLTFSTQGGIDYVSGQSIVYLPEFLQFQRSQPNPGDVVSGQQSQFNFNIQAFLGLNTNFAGISSSTQIGWVRLGQESNVLLVRGQGLAPGQRNVQQAQVQTILQQDFEEFTDVGLVAQEELNWQDRLILTLGVRFDKSTLNGDANEFFPFYKASLAANLTNFDFWNVPFITQLKPRFAYGETGGIPAFGQLFSPLSGVNIDGRLGSIVNAGAGNSELEPETAAEIEVGLDVGFLNNRISLEATYYIKEVRDLILDLNLSTSTGISTIPTNLADLENTGVELALTAQPIVNSNIEWLSRVLFWSNEQEITRLDIPSSTRGGFGAALGTYLIEEGRSPTTIVGTPELENQPGVFTEYGDALPDYQLSFFNQVTLFNSLDFSMLWHYSNGGANINLTTFLTDDGGTTFDWNDDDDGDGVPNGQDRGPFNAGRFVEDATYWKLREIGLYYRLPESLLTTISGDVVQGIRVGFSGNNLLLFSDYNSYDPEVSNFGAQAIAQSVEVTPYPTSRRFLFHLQFEF